MEARCAVYSREQKSDLNVTSTEESARALHGLVVCRLAEILRSGAHQDPWLMS